jgi:hypothetical protein
MGPHGEMDSAKNYHFINKFHFICLSSISVAISAETMYNYFRNYS